MSWKRLSGVSKKSNDQEEDTSSQKSLLTAALFEDKWSKITESHLKVKNYFFPTAQSKKIPIKSIQAVFYEQQDMLKQACMVKGWGMAYTPVWWACDCKRNCQDHPEKFYNVLIETGDAMMKGFTVMDIQRFLSVLTPLLNPGTILCSQFPF